MNLWSYDEYPQALNMSAVIPRRTERFMMTKNSAFKKTIRATMGTHNLSYTNARKFLDEESHLQGTGSITLIVGATGAGKTIEFREMLRHQTLPTAVLLAHEQDIEYVGTTHYLETLSTKKKLQDLAEQQKYSLFAIDGIGYHTREHKEEYFLDVLPSKANLILTMQFAPINDIREALEYLDKMNLSREKLSQRVELIKHASQASARSFGRLNTCFHVTDHLL